jgi:hypothetical protein
MLHTDLRDFRAPIRERVTARLHVELANRQEQAVWAHPGFRYNTQGSRSSITCGVDGAWLVNSLLTGWGLTLGSDYAVDLTAATLRAAEQQTDIDRIEARLQGLDELRGRVAGTKHAPWDWFKPFQRETLAFAGAWEGGHVHQAPGAGKTGQMVVWSLLQPGPVIVVTKAAVRTQFAGEVRKLTHIEPYVVVPKGKQRASFGSYMQRCGPVWSNPGAEAGLDLSGGPLLTGWTTRPYVIVPWSSLVNWLPTLLQLGPATLVLDEIHMGKAAKREKWVPGPTGKPEARPVESRSAAAYTLANACRRSLGGTATDVYDRMRDLWGQLTLVQPKGWGRTANKFYFHYCAAKPNEGFGGLDTTGASNTEELRKRASKVALRTTYDRSHGELPAKRTEVIYIHDSDLNRASSYASELKRAAKDGSESGPGSTREVKLARCASMKRRFTVDFIVDKLEQGQKVLVFDSRHDNCDRWAQALVKAWKGAQPAAQTLRDGVTILGGESNIRQIEDANVWLARGGLPASEVDRVHATVMGALGTNNPDDGEPHPGPCVVIGTYQKIGTGMNWQDHDALGWIALPENPGQLWQGENRVSRLGQMRSVTVFYFVAEGTYDEDQCDTVIEKFRQVEAMGGPKTIQGLGEKLKGLDDPTLMEQLVANIAASVTTDDEDDEHGFDIDDIGTLFEDEDDEDAGLVVNLRDDSFDVYIGRVSHAPPGCPPERGGDGFWGNPVVRATECPVCGVFHASKGETLECHARWLTQRAAEEPTFAARLQTLRGKRLGCWCAPGPCHGDNIVRWLDANPGERVDAPAD